MWKNKPLPPSPSPPRPSRQGCVTSAMVAALSSAVPSGCEEQRTPLSQYGLRHITSLNLIKSSTWTRTLRRTLVIGNHFNYSATSPLLISPLRVPGDMKTGVCSPISSPMCVCVCMRERCSLDFVPNCLFLMTIFHCGPALCNESGCGPELSARVKLPPAAAGPSGSHGCTCMRTERQHQCGSSCI